jgi:hypothetical protein
VIIPNYYHAGRPGQRGPPAVRVGPDVAGRLRAYYEAQGFVHADDADVPRLTRAGNRSASRYQRPVATVDR